MRVSILSLDTFNVEFLGVFCAVITSILLVLGFIFPPYQVIFITEPHNRLDIVYYTGIISIQTDSLSDKFINYNSVPTLLIAAYLGGICLCFGGCFSFIYLMSLIFGLIIPKFRKRLSLHCSPFGQLFGMLTLLLCILMSVVVTLLIPTVFPLVVKNASFCPYGENALIPNEHSWYCAHFAGAAVPSDHSTVIWGPSLGWICTLFTLPPILCSICILISTLYRIRRRDEISIY